jgi:acetyl esterase
MVISVDYALAPEHKYPAAVHECLAALQWVLVHAAELGIDSERVAVAGDSAGANLATVVAAAQSRAVGSPALVGQILLYPVADLANFDSGSYREHAEGLFLTRDTMRWFASHYLRSAADALLEQVSPLRAKDLSQLPRALVITAEYDPLRDEGEAYAARLQAAGVSTQLTRYPGMIHGFFSMSAFLDGGKAATTEVLGSLRDVFGIPERARV